MPRYQYSAVDKSGKKVKGTLTAESSFAARKQLRVRMLHPTTLKEVSFQDEGRSVKSLFRRTSTGQIIDFTKQLSTLINSGIKLTDAMSVLIKQCGDPRFRTVLIDIRDRVMTGESFADTLADYSDFFDVIYVSMIRVGEMTGSFGKSLATIAGFMEKRRKLESKFITAMIYPAILVLAGLAVMIVLTTAVIPRIGSQIEKMGQELPFVTRAVMGVSDIMTSKWILLIIAVLVLIIAMIRRFVKTPRGAFMKDRFMLSMPIMGPLIRQRVVSRFTSTLSTLLGSGLPMAESLRVVSEVTGNAVMSKAVKEARERILSGADIASPLSDSGVIDPAIAHMVAVGEKSGELETMLQNISDDLEASADIVIDRISAVIEPVIIVIMACFVGILGYAMILPLIKFSTGAIR